MSITGKWFGFGQSADYDEGLRHFDVGSYVAAIDAFHRSMRSSSDPAVQRLARYFLMDSYRLLAITRIDERQYDEAIACADAAIAIRPDYPDLFVLSARALLGAGELKQAYGALDRALSLNPRYAEAAYLQGVVLFAMGEHDMGLSEMRAAMENNPRFAGDAFESGRRSHETGNAAQAVEGFLTYTARIVDEANARANYGDLLVREQKFDEAAEAYSAAIAIQPRYPDIRCKYGQTLLELDRVEEAEAEFRAALEVNGRYAEAHAQLGIALKRQNKIDEAREHFLRAYDIDPHHPIADMELKRR